VDAVLNASANLGDIDKSIAEFWADGPDTTAPPGHWFKIAADAAAAVVLDLQSTVQLLFATGNAVMDAGIGSWSAKLMYSGARPITMIQCLNGNQTVGAQRRAPAADEGRGALRAPPPPLPPPPLGAAGRAAAGLAAGGGPAIAADRQPG
jgi:hypothetical protein